ARDEDPLPVPTTEVPVGRQRRVGGSQGARDGAREQVALRLEVQEADRRLEQRAVHALADPALVAVEERVHDAEGAEDPRGEVEEGHAATDGSAARLARDGHDAAERLHERLVGRAPGARILHLDDVGAHVAEERAAEGPGQDAGEIHDADAIEREGGHGHVRYYNAMSALRDALTRRILVLDGAMGTMLQAAGLTAA